jgi:hypothetical protein
MALRSMVPVGKCFSGYALTYQGELSEGIAQIRGGISELRTRLASAGLPMVHPGPR